MRYKLIPYLGFLLLCFVQSVGAFAQQKEIITEHAAWGAVFGTFRVSERQSVYADVQHNKGAFTIVRAGIVQHLPYQTHITAGYAFAWLPVPGADSEALVRHEHRPWLQLFAPHAITHNLSLSTRLRYDMRFRQRVEQAVLQQGFEFNHRLRLQEILRIDLSGLRFEDVLPYLALSNEILLNFGKEITYNTFDQNRLGLMAGLERRNIRLQAGYVNRFVQSGSVPGSYISNHNYTVWLFYRLDLRKKQVKQE